MQSNLRLFGGALLLLLIATVEVAPTVSTSTREKIAMHKAWLAQRSQSSDPFVSQSPRIDVAHKSMEPKSESKVSYLRKLAKFKQDQINRRTTPNPNLNEVILIEPSNDPQQATTPLTTAIKITSSASPSGTIDANALIPATSTEHVPVVTEPVTAVEANNTDEAVFTTSSSVAKQVVAVPTDTATSEAHHNLVPPKRRRKAHHAAFSSWGKWSECSRSCGSGVTSQQRNCFTRHPMENGTVERRHSQNCIGLQKRFRVCNEQSCPDTDVDFREWQCSQFNNLTFSGKQYNWEAYVKDDAECELNCKPTDMDMFAMLQERVADGTVCTKPVHLQRALATGEPDRKAVCVDGFCKNWKPDISVNASYNPRAYFVSKATIE